MEIMNAAAKKSKQEIFDGEKYNLRIEDMLASLGGPPESGLKKRGLPTLNQAKQPFGFFSDTASDSDSNKRTHKQAQKSKVNSSITKKKYQ